MAVRFSKVLTLCLLCAGFLSAEGWLFKRSECGGKKYSGLFKRCCENVIQPKRIKGACCGTESYSQLTKMCCDGSVQSKLKIYPECCGKKSYSRLTKKCVNGELVKIGWLG